jgi:serine/threonine protein kinase
MQVGIPYGSESQPFRGKKVGDYVLSEQIGKGTYGAVHKATKSDGTVVAIKVISKVGMVDERQMPTKLQELFNKEVDIMRMIVHPKIIRLREKLQSGNNYYLVLDYCEDGDLKQYLERNIRMPEGDALEALKQISLGFRELHRLGIMHRDFKPANVFIHKGNFIIGDLGMAKQSSTTQTKVGTPITMAPEVSEAMALGGQRIYDSTVDLFSLGVTFYYMLYGVWPWKPDNYLAYYMKTQVGDKLPFPAGDDNVSEFTKKLLRGMIALKETRLDWPTFFFELDKLKHTPKTFLGEGVDEGANDKLFDAEVKLAMKLQKASGSQKPTDIQMCGYDEIKLDDVKLRINLKPDEDVAKAVKQLLAAEEADKVSKPKTVDDEDIKYWKEYTYHFKCMIQYCTQQSEVLRVMWKEKSMFPKPVMDLVIPAYVVIVNKLHLYLVNLISLLKGYHTDANQPIANFLKTDFCKKMLQELGHLDAFLDKTFKTAKAGLKLESDMLQNIAEKPSQFLIEAQQRVSSPSTSIPSLSELLNRILGRLCSVVPPFGLLPENKWHEQAISRQGVMFLRIYECTYELEEFPLINLDQERFDWAKRYQRKVKPPEVIGIYYKARGRTLP